MGSHEASNYEQLVKALRYCGNFAEREGCAESCEYFNDMDCPNRIMSDAAAAIEELLPKRGKWIVHTEVKNIYGGICVECPVCRDHFVVLNVSDEKYCRRQVK